MTQSKDLRFVLVSRRQKGQKSPSGNPTFTSDGNVDRQVLEENDEVAGEGRVARKKCPRTSPPSPPHRSPPKAKISGTFLAVLP
jgi:hypothetical protein